MFLFIEEHWDGDNNSDVEEERSDGLVQPIPLNITLSENFISATTLSTWIFIFLLRLQGQYYLPDNAIDDLFKFMSEVFKIMKPYSTFNSHLSCNFPTSLNKAKNVTINHNTASLINVYDCEI